MKTVEELETWYEQKLKREIEPLEKERKNFVKKTGIIWGVAVILVVTLFILVRFPLSIFLSVCICLVAMFPFFYQSHLFHKRFLPKFKKQVIEKIVKFVDDRLDYTAEKGIMESAFRDSAIFLKKPDIYASEDHMSGTIGRTRIEFAEVHAFYKTKSGKEKQISPVFNGLFFIADFNKDFTSRTVVLPDNFGTTFAFLGDLLRQMDIERDPLVKLEDPEFEHHFVVHSTDQVEARYILSTSLMARIMDFRKKTNAKILLSFVGNKMFVAIPLPFYEQLFEINAFKSVLNFNQIKDYASLIALAVSIVEDLNLNTRIWSKGGEVNAENAEA